MEQPHIHSWRAAESSAKGARGIPQSAAASVDGMGGHVAQELCLSGVLGSPMLFWSSHKDGVAPPNHLCIPVPFMALFGPSLCLPYQ